MWLFIARTLLPALLIFSSIALANPGVTPMSFTPSTTCKGCHPHIYEEYDVSMHNKSFSNPLFQAQLAKEVLPETVTSKAAVKEAKGCIFCHAPILSMTSDLPSSAELKPQEDGISCDFCHTLTGIDNKREYLSDPQGKKLGPIKSETWHSKYSEFIGTSEFCAICHNAHNRNSVEIKSTFSEWREGKHAANGTQCQDCHMSLNGYQDSSGKSQFATGKVAYLGGISQERKENSKLYSHRFPGAHSKTQMGAALKVRLGGNDSYQIGEPYSFVVFVDNTRTGHKMPTGSTDLRLLWLEVTIRTDKGSFTIPASRADRSGYDVAGVSPFDAQFLSRDVPKGSRIYRTVFGDQRQKPIASSFDAFSILFDNRLKESERRMEQLSVNLDKWKGLPVRIEARLMYRMYPTSLAVKLGIAPAVPTIMAEAEKTILPAKETAMDNRRKQTSATMLSPSEHLKK